MNKQFIIAASLLFSALCPIGAYADPGYYVVPAYDSDGERSIDFRYWTVKLPGYPETIWPELGFGYGVNSRWYTEFYGSTIGTSRNDLKLDTWNWQNDILLTQGEYPFDLALHTNFVKAHEADEGYSLEYGPAFQTDIDRVQLNANVFLERPYHSSYGNTTQLKYQWQVKYRWHPLLQVGVQGFGELGDWNDWAPRDQQSHRAGPAVFGSFPIEPSMTLKYQAGYMMGSVYGQHGNMLTARVQFVF